MTKHFQSNIWILIERAEDIPGEWVATCPDFYVVSQGRSLKHAYAMIREAVLQTIVDDLEAKRDPLDRRAPKRIWDELWGMLKRAEKRPPGEPFPEDDAEIGAFLVQVPLDVSLDRPKRSTKAPSTSPKRHTESLALALAVYGA